MKKVITRADLTLNPILTILGFTKFAKKVPQPLFSESKLSDLRNNEMEVEFKYFGYAWCGIRLPAFFNHQ